jgi:hypothetical protein
MTDEENACPACGSEVAEVPSHDELPQSVRANVNLSHTVGHCTDTDCDRYWVRGHDVGDKHPWMPIPQGLV